MPSHKINTSEKNITVVLASRVNSSRCPRKVIKNFDEDQSLFEILCQTLKQVKFPVAAAVGEPELIAIAEKHSLPVILRSDDEVNASGPLRRVFKCIEKVETSHAMIIGGCSPFITAKTLNDACEFFVKSPHLAMTSVIQEKNWFFDRNGKPFWKIDVHNMTSNDLCVYALANVFEVFPVDRFLSEGIYYTFENPSDPFLYEISKTEAFDINTQEEFELGAYLWKYRKQEKSDGRKL